MRILVCGGRDFTDKEFMYAILDSFDRKLVSVIISGMAPGADRLAAEWAIKHRVPLEEYPAQWKEHGKSAGIKRNIQMLREGAPDLVVAFPGGNGTAHMVSISLEANIPTLIIGDK